MELGRWYNKPITLTTDGFIRLLSAATKSNSGCNDSCNSYKLVSERKSVDRLAWTSKDHYAIPDIADSDFFEDQPNKLE